MNPRRFVLLLLLLLASPVPAVAADDLYVGETPVADQSVEVRAEALETALGQVLVRVSGDPDILERGAAAGLLSHASDWVVSYGYEKVEEKREDRPGEAGPEGEIDGGGAAAGDAAVVEDAMPPRQSPGRPAGVEGIGVDGSEAVEAMIENSAEPEKTLLLRARFDATAVERALRREGLPVWGRERPRTLVFLVIEGEADIVSARAADELAAAMRETADRRGAPLVFPERGGAERRAVRAADIRYGDLQNARAAARAYDASHVLVGRLARVGGGWRGEWTLSHRGDMVAEWSGGGAEADDVLADGARRLADTYAHRFAVYGGAEADTVVAVAVDGVTAIEDYARVGRYLRELTAVKTATPVLVDREAVVFRVQLSGDVQVLMHGIELADWLREDELARNLAALYAAGGRALGYRIGS